MRHACVVACKAFRVCLGIAQTGSKSTHMELCLTVALDKAPSFLIQAFLRQKQRLCRIGMSKTWISSTFWWIVNTRNNQACSFLRLKMEWWFGRGAKFDGMEKLCLNGALDSFLNSATKMQLFLQCPVAIGNVNVASSVWFKMFGRGRKSLKKPVMFEDAKLGRGFLGHSV